MRRLPVLREADVGRGAADVERDHVVVAGLLAGPDAADDAGDGAGHEQVDRPRDRALRRGHAARRRHQVELRPDLQRLELLLEAADVARDLRADVGVEADGREALVLAVLRQDLRRDREEGLGELLAHDLGHALLVRRVEEREEEADGDGLDAGLLQLPDALARPLLVERHEHGAVLQDPLGHGQAVAAPDDRVPLPGQVLVVREVERLLVPRDVEDVAVALGRDQADASRRCARSRCSSRSSCRGRPGRAPTAPRPPARSAPGSPARCPRTGPRASSGACGRGSSPLSSST